MSIRNKIIGYYFFTLVIVFFLFIISSRYIISNYLYSEIKEDLYREARVTTLLLIDEYKSNNEIDDSILEAFIETRNIIRNMKFESMMSFFYYSNKNESVIRNDNRMEANVIKDIENYIINNDRNIEIEIEGVKYFGIIHGIKNDISSQTDRVYNRDKQVYVLIYVKASQVKVLTNEIMKKQLVFILIALIIVLFIGTLIANSITRPLRRLNKQTKEITKRNYEKLLVIKGKGEIRQLSTSINKMAKELDDYEQEQNRFLQNSSHELKTPLMSIKGYAEGMIDGLVEKNESNLQIIIEESDRLRKIVEGISFLSRLESKHDYFKFEEKNILDVIEKANSKITGLALSNNIKLINDIKYNANIFMDEDKFIQAMINIYSNCVRYAKSTIVTSIIRSKSNILISITDDGKGFNEMDLAHVFERFYKGDDGDNGLGLAITNTIIKKHNGVIVASNSIDKGAKYTITIPIKE